MVTTKNVAEKVATKPTDKTGEQPKTLTQKNEIPEMLPEKRPVATLPPIEARLKKLEEITELAERREVVTEAIQNLAGFYIAPNGTGCNMRLQDSKGKTFAIAHPSVIGEMVSMAKQKLSAELSRIENLIDFTI